VSEKEFVSPRSGFVPAYLKLRERDPGELARRVERAVEGLAACAVCPHECGVNRLEDETSTCETGRLSRVGSCFPHLGEEDPLRGWRGSGTIFFAFCNLKCVFCQNSDLSWEGRSSPKVSADDLARMMLWLQQQGCHNINFVTPAHVVPQILEALPAAIEGGLHLPIVHNTSAYDSAGSLALLDGIVDIYMPDFKFWNPATAKRLTAAEDYPEVARAALIEMHRQVGPLTMDEDGVALRGVLLRHLVMPEDTAGTREIMRFVAEKVSKHTFVNVMDQYHPAGRVLTNPDQYSEITRRTSIEEYRDGKKAAREVGLYRFAR
jgi:putative pyruvate formate lyase activating enzyme